MGHMLEYICNAEVVANPFDETGNCAGEISDGIPPPQRMKWNISQAVCSVNVLYCIIIGSFGGIKILLIGTFKFTKIFSLPNCTVRSTSITCSL